MLHQQANCSLDDMLTWSDVLHGNWGKSTKGEGLVYSTLAHPWWKVNGRGKLGSILTFKLFNNKVMHEPKRINLGSIASLGRCV